jgi:hypothetical protein
MYTLDFDKVSPEKLQPEEWRDEIENNIAFPMVNMKKLVFVDGYSPDEEENPYMNDIMYDEVMVRHLVDYENKKVLVFQELQDVDASDNRKTLACIECHFCGDSPCVWLGERHNVVTNDQLEHANTFGIENKTRRRVAYRYMFRIINGDTGQKGIRKRQPECVENGIRALFPDENYMGFKEE